MSRGEPARRLPRGALLRFGLLVAVLAVCLALARWSPLAEYLTREQMVAFFERLRQLWWSPLVLIGLFATGSPLGGPVSPLVFAGGAVFGPVAGTLYNTVGLFLGSASTYLLGKWLGRDFVAHVAGKRLRKVERAFDRRGFWPLVQVRFLPLPFSLVNYGAAFAGVRLSLFLVATAVGLGPITFLHTYYASRFALLFESQATPREWMAVAVPYALLWGLLAAITSLPAFLGARRRRLRYRRLVEERRARSS